MPAPFRVRVARQQSFIGRIMRTLDIPRFAPAQADLELNNYLATLESWPSLSPAAVDGIYTMNRIEGKDRRVLQERILRTMITYQMRDDRLSEDERRDLALLVHGLGLDPAIGKGLCAEIGRDIYFERLADSKADGIISADERSRLNRIRQTFGLTVDVPPQGMDYTQAVATAMQRASILFEEVRRSVSSLTGAYAAAVTANPVIGNHPQCVTVASQLQRWHDTIGECKRIAASATSDADGYSLVINAEVKASAVRCEIQMSLVPQEVETFATWRRKTVKQVEKARADAIKSAEHERQIASRRVAEAAGFEITRGSAASRAWAYCIIVEQCLVTAEWQALADAGTDHADASLKEWLLHRPATFWTDDFAGAGFTAARAAFAESSTRGRKRPAKANVTTDFDLSIG